MAETAWSLVPPVITIVLALVTKEVYMSLAIGIFIGAFMFTGFNFLGAIDTMFDIMSNKVGGNVNILVFLVLLGIIVSAIQNQELLRRMVIMQRGRLMGNDLHCWLLFSGTFDFY